jgi:hypothetical protein
VLVVVGTSGVDGEDVPVDRTLARQGHVGEQRDFVVTEPVEATITHELERGAVVVRDDLAQRQHLVAR